MTATIAYDKLVKNLIDQLSATGHVTHTAYTKKSVTLHHNGGRLSHEGVLSVWKTRPASAHFDADGVGALAQYVKVNEYAWAVGNAQGNRETISIEMANKTTSPDWTVADATWQAAARLAGWLLFKVVGQRPSKDNLFYHKHWSSTECAGPYMDKIYAKVLKAAQDAYDAFKKAAASPSSPAPSTPAKKSVEAIAKEVIAGKWDNGPARVRLLIAAGYDAKAVQAKVDELLHKTTGRKTVHEVANEIFLGKGGWGNNPGRANKLRAAGYNPIDVQREVNKLMTASRK